MIDSIDPIPPQNIYRVDPTRPADVPFYEALVPAGFPSPAETYVERRLNLHDLCVRYPDATFVRVAGESMIGAHILPGSILVVDAAQRNCQSANDRLQKKQKLKDLASQVEQNKAQSAKEKERVVSPPKADNADWQAADRRCQAQQGCYKRNEQALEVNMGETRELTRPGNNYWRGWAIGIFLGLILVSIWYKVYRLFNWKVDLTFGLISAGGVVLSGWEGAKKGREIDNDQRTPAQEEALEDELEALQQERATLKNERKQVKARLNELEVARDELDPFAADLPPTTSADEEPLPTTDPV
jgi:hypothetical protein